MIPPIHERDLRAADVEVGLAEARTRLGELVNRVHEGTVVYLTLNGTPTAAILPIEELRRLVEAEEELEDLRAVLAADRDVLRARRAHSAIADTQRLHNLFEEARAAPLPPTGALSVARAEELVREIRADRETR